MPALSIPALIRIKPLIMHLFVCSIVIILGLILLTVNNYCTSIPHEEGKLHTSQANLSLIKKEMLDDEDEPPNTIKQDYIFKVRGRGLHEERVRLGLRKLQQVQVHHPEERPPHSMPQPPNINVVEDHNTGSISSVSSNVDDNAASMEKLAAKKRKFRVSEKAVTMNINTRRSSSSVDDSQATFHVDYSAPRTHPPSNN